MCMTKQTEEKSVKRDYKSRMFTMIFRDKKELLQLLRFLLYLSDLYEKMIVGKNVYGTKIIQIPAPKFIVFYNGKEERPEKEVIKLSNSYMTQDEEVSLELLVDVLNINIGHNKELLQACKTLGDYSEYVYRVREYAKEMSIEEAVDRAIDECIREDILREFLERNRAEARAMSIYEYNQEEHIRLEREDAFEDGRKLGKEEGKEEGREEGKRNKLIDLVQKKLAKNQSVEQIADDLVEQVETIQQIVKEF